MRTGQLQIRYGSNILSLSDPNFVKTGNYNFKILILFATLDSIKMVKMIMEYIIKIIIMSTVRRGIGKVIKYPCGIKTAKELSVCIKMIMPIKTSIKMGKHS